jgi:lipoprotein-releasing system ATP-binding protein
MSVVLQADHVNRRLEGEIPVTLVDDISLTIDRGEFVTIMGPSGSGKSSLLYLLSLLDPPTRGRVLLDGVDASLLNDDELAALRLEKLGFVFQFHFLLAEFSALENVRLPMRRLNRLRDNEQMERAEMLLNDLGLTDHRHKLPSQLSGGQRQRVAIARALANDPLVILADEPTGNLDTQSSKVVSDILVGLSHQKNMTVVAVTHDPAFAKSADRIVTLVDGRLQD